MLEGTMTGGMMALRNNKMVCLAGGSKKDFEVRTKMIFLWNPCTRKCYFSGLRNPKYGIFGFSDLFSCLDLLIIYNL